MGKFLDGFFAGAIFLCVGAFLYLYYGSIDPRADTPAGALETWIATPSLDASLTRLTPRVWNPVQPDEADLLAGMRLYQTHCASCHGDLVHPEATFADALNPPPPQFVKDRPHRPDNQNFYIILHGIRWTGMPGWNHKLSEKQIWQVTTFLSQMHNLPQPVADGWKAAAVASPPLR